MSIGRRRRAGPRPKHVPQRTCLGCRQVEGKREMVRIVRTPEGRVEVDETGRRNGRGAYLHRDRRCWETALRRKQLQAALRTEVSAEDQATLVAYAQSMPEPAARQQDEA